MLGIIGKKIGMTSMFDDEGKHVACTLIKADPNVITQIKTKEKDGYEALQLASVDKKEKNTPKALLNHFKKANTTPKRVVKEMRDTVEGYQLGDLLGMEIFSEGDWVDVIGNSKGKGFQGVVKRHNFAGVGQSTHGQHNRNRAPGSIGACSTPSRVFKGMKMAGRTGAERVKAINLQILKLIQEKNIIIVKGAVPGHKGSYVIVEK